MNLADYKDTDFKMEVVDQSMASIFSNFTCGNANIDKHFLSSSVTLLGEQKFLR